jgi:hypothetical protein
MTEIINTAQKKTENSMPAALDRENLKDLAFSKDFRILWFYK